MPGAGALWPASGVVQATSWFTVAEHSLASTGPQPPEVGGWHETNDTAWAPVCLAFCPPLVGLVLGRPAFLCGSMGDLGAPQTQSPSPLSATTAGNLPKATGSGALVLGGSSSCQLSSLGW